MNDGQALVRRLVAAGPEKRRRILAALTEYELMTFDKDWPAWVRFGQAPPPGSDWRVWLLLGGRGFGKTRAGAEWVRASVRGNPDARIALVAASLNEARAVMVEGESGILAVASPGKVPRFEPSLRRLTWPNGAQAFLYSAAEPESLRGPQHSHASGAGAEGIHAQRGVGEDRCRIPSGGGGGRRPASFRRNRRAVLAGRRLGDRLLRGSRE